MKKSYKKTSFFQIGKIRNHFINVLILIFTITTCFIAAVIFYLLFNEKWNILLVLSLLIYLISFEIYVRFRNRYYVYKANEFDYERLKNKKLIHYTNNISDHIYAEYLKTGIITLNANNNAKSNYVMKFKDKKKPFVWFHQEDDIQKSEPNLLSFLQTHYDETTPRKYKVLVDPSNIDISRIFIRPDNHNIVVENNLEVKAKVVKTFNWYNNKLYLKQLFITIINYFYSMNYTAIHQLIGLFIEIVINWKNRNKFI